LEIETAEHRAESIEQIRESVRSFEGKQNALLEASFGKRESGNRIERQKAGYERHAGARYDYLALPG